MEKNKPIENNSSEHIVNQELYKYKKDSNEKKAVVYARMAQFILGVTIFSFLSGGYILIRMNKGIQDIEIGIIIFLFVVLYLLSFMFAVLGYYYMKTEVTRRALQAEVIIPVCVIGGLLLLLYVIWGAFGVWASGKTTFVEYLIWLFN